MSLNNIKVSIRLRPLTRKEISDGQVNAWASPSSSSLSLSSQPSLAPFYFDTVFHPNDTNSDLYNSIGKDIVQSCMEGINGY